MYGDEFICIFSAFEWNEILRMFVNEVKAKRYDKLEYDVWRELKEISESMETLEQVRVYWNTDYDHYIPINVYIDSKANGKPDMPFEFDSDDSSFGSFLYGLELYREEKEQMKVKDHYINSSDWQTYDGSYHSKDYYLSADDLKSYGLGVSVLDEKADVVCDTFATKADINALNQVEEKINTLAAEVAAATPMKNTINDKKENNVMKFNFDFGPVNSSMVRMSLYGLAVKNKAGTWVSYDAKAGDIMDVDILNFDGAKFLYKMPVATKDIAIGDVVIHNGIPMFVIAIATNGAYITAVDPINGERKDIMLPKSPFGFNFATKVVNFLGNLNTGADASNPFGNLGLMLMLNDNKDMGDLLPLMLMTGNSGLDMSNPLMLYALMGNDSKSGNDNILPMLMMLNAQHPVAPVHTCTCGGHCAENHTQG
jgi:hypothetical protein